MHDHAVDAAHSMLALQLCELALLAQWLRIHKPKVGITTETAMAWHDHAAAAGHYRRAKGQIISHVLS
jgi:hypothetical protein